MLAIAISLVGTAHRMYIYIYICSKVQFARLFAAGVSQPELSAAALVCFECCMIASLFSLTFLVATCFPSFSLGFLAFRYFRSVLDKSVGLFRLAGDGVDRAILRAALDDGNQVGDLF